MTSIMVVEDERVVANDLEETLIRLGYEVAATTGSGEECLRLAPSGKPDLVLMDIRIKGSLDGIETTARLKAQLDVPVIYLTAYADDETLARARRTEAHGYLLKPFRASELKSAIEIALFKHQTDQKLRTRERWFSTTLRAIGDGVIAVDPELRVAFANPVAEELTGVGAELTGRRFSEVFRLINARTRESLNDPVQEVLAARVPARLPAGTLLVRGDETVPIEDSIAPILDDRGDLLGAVVVFRDAREQEALREQVAASDRLASLGTLAAGIAHEINNPLTYIAANANSMTRQLTAVNEMLHSPDEFTDLVCDPLAVLSSLQQEVGEIEEGAERIRRIVADLGMFGRAELNPGKGDVLHALKWALRVTESITKPRAALSLRLGAVPKVYGDVTRIGQVLINLLVNAAQAIPEESSDAHQIFVSTGVEDDGVVVAIRDTGSGMAPEVLRRIFDPFFTTKPPGTGTGLGLSVCARLVDAMGGALTVTSTPGVGSTFRLWLQSAEDSREGMSIDSAGVVQRGRILVVENDRATACSIARMLGDRHDVVIERDTRSAMTRLAVDPAFDVLLCDLVLPELAGVSLHRELSCQRPELAERLVFLTGGFAPEASEFLARVQNPRVPKPLSPDELERCIRSVLCRDTC